MPPDLSTQQTAPGDPPLRRSRTPGLIILIGLVALGMGLPAYLQWKVPQLEADRDRIRSSAPSDAEGLLASWFRFGQPMIHTALVKARFSAQRPWYVSYMRESDQPDQPPEVWGIDFTDLDHNESIFLDGLDVIVRLEEPSLLAREELQGRNNQGVPRFAAGEEVDAADLTRRRLLGFRHFEVLMEALGRDIPEARLVIQIGDNASEEGE